MEIDRHNNGWELKWFEQKAAAASEQHNADAIFAFLVHSHISIRRMIAMNMRIVVVVVVCVCVRAFLIVKYGKNVSWMESKEYNIK